jgi:hypothetical protein
MRCRSFRTSFTAASRAQTRSRIASCASSGTQTDVSSPARERRASTPASRRSVLTRSPGRLGVRDDLTDMASGIDLAIETITAGACFIDDTCALHSKNWNEFAIPNAPALDFAFTLCDDAAGETCPGWPGQLMTAHWGIEDPVVVEGPDSRRGALSPKLSATCATGSRPSLLCQSRVSTRPLTARLREIGQMEGVTRVLLKVKDAHHG